MSVEDNKNKKSDNDVASVDNSTQNLVDIDTIKIKLLFLCKNKKNYESAASYLIRRGWETLILGSVKEAFSTISTFKPDFVVVSVNLPTAKIQQLPTVIYNTFRCPVITFGEESDTKTMGLLQSTAANYKMPGAVSGPSAHRRLKQILQDTYRPDIAAAKSNADQNRNPNEPTVKTQHNQNSAPLIFTSDKKDKGPGYYIAKGEEQKEYGLGIKNTSKNINHNETVEHSATPDLNMLAELFTETQTPITANEKTESTVTNTGVTIIRVDSTAASTSAQAKNIESEEIDKKAESAKFDSPEFKNTIVQMAKECVFAQETNAAVESPGMSMTAWAAEINGNAGYLITQYKGSKTEHAQFNIHLINRTKDYYAKSGIPCFIYDEITLPISQEQFGHNEDVVLFSESFSAGGGEAVVKFIKGDQEKPKLEFIKKLNKYKIYPKDLIENVNAGANLYLHLPKNEKFYLYLNENAVLSTRQKQKLIDTETPLYIEADEAKKYERTFARNCAIDRLLKSKRRTAA